MTVKNTVSVCRCRLLLLSAVLAASGCNDSTLVPVEGKVTLDKKPLTTGSVMFHPDKSKGNESEKYPRAEITSEGTYRLYTNEEPGAPPGWYKVTVRAYKPADENADGEDIYSEPEPLVANDYLDAEYTPLKVEVKRDAPDGHYDLEVSSQ